MTPISSIYRQGSEPVRRANAQERNQAARAQVWHEHGVAVIDPADVADDWIRAAIESEAIRQYGQRKKGRGDTA